MEDQDRIAIMSCEDTALRNALISRIGHRYLLLAPGIPLLAGFDMQADFTYWKAWAITLFAALLIWLAQSIVTHTKLGGSHWGFGKSRLGSINSLVSVFCHGKSITTLAKDGFCLGDKTGCSARFQIEYRRPRSDADGLLSACAG